MKIMVLKVYRVCTRQVKTRYLYFKVSPSDANLMLTTDLPPVDLRAVGFPPDKVIVTCVESFGDTATLFMSTTTIYKRSQVLVLVIEVIVVVVIVDIIEE